MAVYKTLYMISPTGYKEFRRKTITHTYCSLAEQPTMNYTEATRQYYSGKSYRVLYQTLSVVNIQTDLFLTLFAFKADIFPSDSNAIHNVIIYAGLNSIHFTLTHMRA